MSSGIDTVLRVIDSIQHLGSHPETGCKRRIAGTREWMIRGIHPGEGGS